MAATHEQPVPAEEARSDARRVGPRRSRTAALFAVAALLLSDGLHDSAGKVGPSDGSAAPLALSHVQVAAHLGGANPGLSDLERERIARAVIRYSAKYDLDPALVLGVIMAESSARPWARSSKGAVGLMQVMPHMKGSLPVAGNLTSVESNIEAGCIILADNIRRLGERRGILAYFWGNEIRGGGYFDRVQAERAAVRRSAS